MMCPDGSHTETGTVASPAGQPVPAAGPWRRLRRFMAEHVRYEVIALLFAVMTINQADRATMSIASAPMSQQLHLDHAQMGWLFSAFAWAYMTFQVAGGWAIDRFGSKRTFAAAIMLWSIFTALIGFTPYFGRSTAVALIFALVFLVGVAAAPSFPANSKIVAAWFPTRERGTASAIFNASQYFAAAVFTPALAWLAASHGWRSIYYAMGAIGILAGVVFIRRIQPPNQHKGLSSPELAVLRDGGATLDMRPVAPKARDGSELHKVRKLLGNRMMLGIYLGQYCISTLTFFFLTWFPVYLVQQRDIPLMHAGLMASVPAIFGFVGGVLGGMFSDALIRRGKSLSVARKMPIYIGMLLSTTIVACNYVSSDRMVLAFMALAFFGKGMGALGWAIVADASPVNASGLNASIFNTFSSFAGITTPIAIGYLVQNMHSFNGALIFVGAHAAMAILSYALIVGPIRRLDPV